MKYIIALLITLAALPAAAAEKAQDRTLTLAIGAEKRFISAERLLADPKTRDITVPGDVSYNKTMHYKAIPLKDLVDTTQLPAGATVEAVASDGFAAALPAAALSNKPNSAEAFVAIEPPASPWPALPGKKASAGPFYIVWRHPAASGIRSEQWPYMVTMLRTVAAPIDRWKKQLAVDDSLPPDAPARAGQALFAAQCMSCHKLNRAGGAEVGPDLNLPENPTEYFKPDALKKYIRNPAALRHWQAMQMPGFDKAALSDAEIDEIIAYLEHMAPRKTP